jgi:hypothetical protein
MDDDEQAPPEIAFEDVVFDLAFHPTHDVVAAGLITGAVELYVDLPRPLCYGDTQMNCGQLDESVMTSIQAPIRSGGQ